MLCCTIFVGIEFVTGSESESTKPYLFENIHICVLKGIYLFIIPIYRVIKICGLCDFTKDVHDDDGDDGLRNKHRVIFFSLLRGDKHKGATTMKLVINLK